MTGSGLAPPPSLCSCGAKATLIQLEVFNMAAGRYQVGTFSEYGRTVGRGRSMRRLIRDGYRFRRWVVSCGKCFVGNSNGQDRQDA